MTSHLTLPRAALSQMRHTGPGLDTQLREATHGPET